MNTPSLQHVLETYGQSWSTTDTVKRLQLFAECLHPEYTYTDPNIQTQGYEQLSVYMTEFQNSLPGGAFAATDLKTHHDRCLMHWNTVDAKGNILYQGASYFQLASDGRLLQMSGFFDAPTAS